MPCPAGAGACGTVDAAPTQGLGGGQFVRLSFSGFPAADSGVSVYYCADINGSNQLNAPGAKPPVCGNTDGLYDEAPLPVQMYPQTSDAQLTPGTGEASMQAAEVGSGGQTIPGSQFVFGGAISTPGFYCDGTSAYPCEIVVTDITITGGSGDFTTDSSNSVAIPIGFASAVACPNAPLVQADSEFGIELILPIVAHLGCSQNASTAVNPLDSAVGGQKAMSNLAAGDVNISFTDDPEAKDEQTSLKSGPFKLIPIALSANTVAFDSQIFGGSTKYGVGQVSLTPTMVAGLMGVDGNWPEAFFADDVVSCSGPSEKGTKGACLGLPCLLTNQCSLFNQLNYVAGFQNFANSAAFWRADGSGANDGLLSWLCAAPKVPISWGSSYPPSSYPTESASAATELETVLGSHLTPGGPPLTSCPAGDQLPNMQAAPVNLLTESDPSQQALKSLSFVQNGLGGGGSPFGASDAWANMNWAEALYYGMSTASLQNAAGQFVQPNAASLDAAVSDAATNPDGSLTPSYTNTSDQTAYPLPDVIYAAVSTTPTDPATATAETDLLNQILALTGTGGTNVGQLPQGFVPLPANLVSTAQADIKTDIVAAPPKPAASTPPTGGSGTTPTASTPAGTNQLGPSGLLGGTPFNLEPTFAGVSPLGSLLANSLAKAGKGTPSGPTGPLLGPALPGYALTANSGNTVMVIVLVLGLIGLLAGLLLLGSGTLTALRGAAKAASAAEAATEDGAGDAGDIASGAAPA